MYKFCIWYLNDFNQITTIHIFADTKDDAVESVKNGGVGFDGRHRVYAKQIVRVERIKDHG